MKWDTFLPNIWWITRYLLTLSLTAAPLLHYWKHDWCSARLTIVQVSKYFQRTLALKIYYWWPTFTDWFRIKGRESNLCPLLLWEGGRRKGERKCACNHLAQENTIRTWALHAVLINHSGGLTGKDLSNYFTSIFSLRTASIHLSLRSTVSRAPYLLFFSLWIHRIYSPLVVFH